MSNEEKILAELEDIRSDLATIKMKLDGSNTNIKIKNSKSNPTVEKQREAFLDLINSISDEEAKEFGMLIDKMELEKGGML